MGSAIVFTLVYFALQVVFLVLCMHIAGRKLGLDFGPFWPAIGKAAVVLLIGAIVIEPLAGYMGILGLVFLIFMYAVAFKFVFGLDYPDAALFTVIYFAIMIALYLVLVLLLSGR